VSCDPAQARQRTAQLCKQAEQGFDLRLGVRLAHPLMARIVPVRIASKVDQFDADRTRVEAEGMVRHAQLTDEARNAAVTINVIVPAVAGGGLRVLDAFPELSRHGHVGQLRAMDHDQVDAIRLAFCQSFDIRQGPVTDHQRIHAASVACVVDGVRC